MIKKPTQWEASPKGGFKRTLANGKVQEWNPVEGPEPSAELVRLTPAMEALIDADNAKQAKPPKEDPEP